ncbi:hypothetical protein HMPREF0322_00770 [Desulfitobacterium hafniense DP7]|uniref:Uncharacterized protein n=1 Tax=Desulfitobacterium hafniense DP7 TaxID=537010 RepID=G9XIJ4_DESHA|nr:hypothetical protein HMPREF0322_00770 [Desulfitobacterium hafniense DP7]
MYGNGIKTPQAWNFPSLSFLRMKEGVGEGKNMNERRLTSK